VTIGLESGHIIINPLNEGGRSMKLASGLRLCLAAAFALVAVLPARAQGGDGRISGTIHDATGAGLSGATVTAVEATSHASFTATSGGGGSYAFTNLPAGTYTVTAELQGFARGIARNVKVEAGGSATADLSLETRLSEEVTVTAMRREATIQDTPVSVAAPTEAELRSRGVEDIEGVARNVAGFSVQNLGPGQSQVAIRGVSSGQIARDQPGVKEQVGAYLDDSVISLSLFTPDIDLFDVSRVEVLRGPQGTLFGSGSESGTVRYISNQPELEKKQMFGEFSADKTNGGGLGGDVKFGFNAPAGTTGAVRVVGYYTHTPGYVDAIQPDGSTKEDVNSGDRTGVRAAYKYQPNENFSIVPRILYQENKTDGWNREDVFNILGNPYTTTRPQVNLNNNDQYTQFEEPFKDKFFLGDLSINYNFGSVLHTSVTSYNHRDVDVLRDATALTASITGGSIGLPESVYTLDAPLDDKTTAKVWTQEVRLSGGNDKLKWVGGGFYSSITRDYGQDLFVDGFEDATGIPTAGNFGAGKDVLFYSRLHYELSQFALFGEGTYSITPEFSVTAGLRYYDFNEDRTQVFDGIFADPASKPGTVDANGVAPRFIASYKVNENTNLNAQVSKGFRLGGINDQLNVPLCTPQDLLTYSGLDTWKDETTWNYEIGSKSRLFDGRGSLNVSAFYMDIKDLQATETAGSCSSRVVLNVPKARSQGFEAEFTAAPNSNLDFALAAAVSDSEMKSTFESAAGDLGIKDGNRLPSVPKFTFSAAVTYQWQATQSARAYVTGTYSHVGSRFTQVGDESLGTLNLLSFGANTIGGPLTQNVFNYDPLLPAYDIVNARVGALMGHWDIALFVNNLTDEEARLALDRERGTRARIGYLTNQPRTFGLSARVTF
jgi:iron complex outermembrane receptor protein